MDDVKYRHLRKENLLYNAAKKESLTQCSVLLNKNSRLEKLETLAVSRFEGDCAYIQPYSYGFMHRHPKNTKVPIFTEIRVWFFSLKREWKQAELTDFKGKTGIFIINEQNFIG